MNYVHLAKLQPTAYLVGAFLGYNIGCTHLIVLATELGDEIDHFRQYFDVIFIKLGVDEELDIDPLILNEAVVVSEILCSDDHGLLHQLEQLARKARISVIVAEPISSLAVTAEQFLSHALERTALTPTFIGSIHVDGKLLDKAIAIFDNILQPSNTASQIIYNTPDSFRVIAIMAVFNEGDIIVCSLEKLLEQRIEVYLIDNWSTDGSYEVVANRYGSRLVGMERFPMSGPTECYDWHGLLSRKEELAQTLQADWFIHCDADEIRYTPWLGVSLRDALYRVDQEGYNAIDHTVVDFHPIDNGFRQGMDFEEYFRHFAFGSKDGYFVQIKTWKNTNQPVLLADHGGHQVLFEDRRIYPYKFLIKHYPVRSHHHGVRKVFQERRSRYLPSERERGWHLQYDAISENHSFLKDPVTLTQFDINHFYNNHLVQRLTGIGSLLRVSSMKDEFLGETKS